MAELRVLYYPDDPLTRKADPVEIFDEDLARFAADLFDTMRAYEGVGLAAPQVGVSKRLFVLQEPDGEEMCLVNAEIVSREGSAEDEEGCLSMPGLYAMVPRATKIAVRAQDLTGAPLELEAEDFLARIIQHESDHIDGILFPQRLDLITQQEVLEEWTELRARVVGEEAGADARHVT